MSLVMMSDIIGFNAHVFSYYILYFKEFVIICFYLKGFWHKLKFMPKTYKPKIHVVQFFFFF